MHAPFFSTKSIWMTWFFWIPLWKAPLFWHPGICTYFLLRDFSRLLVLLVFNEFCDICLTTSNKWVQKIKGQYMNRSTFRVVKYMNGSVFSKARYMNGVDFEILARTPIPQLPSSYPCPPPPHPHQVLEPKVKKGEFIYLYVNWVVEGSSSNEYPQERTSKTAVGEN